MGIRNVTLIRMGTLQSSPPEIACPQATSDLGAKAPARLPSSVLNGQIFPFNQEFPDDSASQLPLSLLQNLLGN